MAGTDSCLRPWVNAVSEGPVYIFKLPLRSRLHYAAAPFYIYDVLWDQINGDNEHTYFSLLGHPSAEIPVVGSFSSFYCGKSRQKNVVVALRRIYTYWNISVEGNFSCWRMRSLCFSNFHLPLFPAKAAKQKLKYFNFLTRNTRKFRVSNAILDDWLNHLMTIFMILPVRYGRWMSARFYYARSWQRTC